MTLFKLPCGVIFTDTFRDYLARLHGAEAFDHPQRVLTLDYVRCGTGPQRGRAWWQMSWMPVDAAPSYRCFHIGKNKVHIPKAAQQGLRERCLDFEGGRVVVKP